MDIYDIQLPQSNKWACMDTNFLHVDFYFRYGPLEFDLLCFELSVRMNNWSKCYIWQEAIFKVKNKLPFTRQF